MNILRPTGIEFAIENMISDQSGIEFAIENMISDQYLVIFLEHIYLIPILVHLNKISSLDRLTVVHNRTLPYER